jgi:CheY-like chemotaxis protein
LGLAIVQRVGKILNHRIDVHSMPGKGSGFFIEVPLGREQANVTHRFMMTRDQIVDPLPRTILVIEDEGFVRMGLESLFSSEGITCVCVATGNEALALVTEKGLRPDLVVSDYNLPGMNGVESIEILRAAVAWKIPAIVLTGEIRSDVIEAIAQHDLSIAIKPTEADELLQLVRGLHANASERAAFGQRPPSLIGHTPAGSPTTKASILPDARPRPYEGAGTPPKHQRAGAADVGSFGLRAPTKFSSTRD